MDNLRALRYVVKYVETNKDTLLRKRVNL